MGLPNKSIRCEASYDDYISIQRYGHQAYIVISEHDKASTVRLSAKKIKKLRKRLKEVLALCEQAEEYLDDE